MNYVPHSPEDIRTMLDRIGLAKLEDLFCDIPAGLRFPPISYPQPLQAALSEPEAMAHLSELSRRNRTPADGPWFLGGGIYNHFVPAVIPALTSRGEFLTAYTPYQPEVSQGTLQALFEYQSMLSELLGMAAVNASHYDGATALAEAILMARHAKPGKVLVPDSLNPAYASVIDSYLGGASTPVERYSGDPRQVKPGAELCAMVVQWPDFLGQLWELDGLADQVHAAGGLLIVHVDPIMLGLVRSPGSLGADIVTAEGQSLGIAMEFGGPALGIMACTQALVRRLPGRLVGQALDHEGRRGFALTLSAREQHIRREKAVSNICSNQGLMALSACIYLASLGPAGLRQVGELCRERAWTAATRIAALPGFRVPALASNTAPGGFCPNFFKEFLIETPANAETLVQDIRKNHGVEAGLPLSRVWSSAQHPGSERQLLVCATEMTQTGDIDRLVAALANPARRSS